MSAEDFYLDAMESAAEGDNETARELLEKAVKADPGHVDAWALYSEILVPKAAGQLTLKDAAKSLHACKKALALDPSQIDLWVRGGRLLADELGMLNEALDWWQDFRHHQPEEVTPILEQATILADMGEYSMSYDRLASIIGDNMDVGQTQFAKIHHLMKLTQAASEQDKTTHFKPWEKNHAGWQAISSKMKKPPISETFLFLAITSPFLVFELFLSNQLSGGGWSMFCLTSVVILMTVLMGMRAAKRWFQMLNRPAFNLLRAMNFEASTGYVVIPEEMRVSVLYMYIMQRKPRVWQERMIKVIESGKKLPKGYKPSYTDFASHLEDIGEILDAEEEELEPFWEEE